MKTVRRIFTVVVLVVALFVIGTVIWTFTAKADYEPVYTEYKTEEAERYIWDALSKNSPSDVITAGIMGYFSRESELRSDSVSGWPTVLAKWGRDLCAEETVKIDSGLSDGSSYDYYIWVVRECGGYGLGQWYSRSYLDGLYSYAQETGRSIGDADMQCEFIFESLQQNEQLWALLLSTEDPWDAGNRIGIYYDGSIWGAGYMGDKAIEFYNKFHEE